MADPAARRTATAKDASRAAPAVNACLPEVTGFLRALSFFQGRSGAL
jgi:hypothetical protein